MKRIEASGFVSPTNEVVASPAVEDNEGESTGIDAVDDFIAEINASANKEAHSSIGEQERGKLLDWFRHVLPSISSKFAFVCFGPQ